MQSVVWCRNLKERDHLEELNVVGRRLLKRVLEHEGGIIWTPFTFMRMGACSGFL
jgi:hypothetical protein